LLGINARFYKYKGKEKEFVEEPGEGDLVFANNKICHIVETKRPWQYKSGWEQILRADE